MAKTVANYANRARAPPRIAAWNAADIGFGTVARASSSYIGDIHVTFPYGDANSAGVGAASSSGVVRPIVGAASMPQSLGRAPIVMGAEPNEPPAKVVPQPPPGQLISVRVKCSALAGVGLSRSIVDNMAIGRNVGFDFIPGKESRRQR